MISAGETVLTRASREWWRRPDDERYLTLKDFYASTRARADWSEARTILNTSLFVRGQDWADGELYLEHEDLGTLDPTHWSLGQLASISRTPAKWIRDIAPIPTGPPRSGWHLVSVDTKKTAPSPITVSALATKLSADVAATNQTAVLLSKLVAMLQEEQRREDPASEDANTDAPARDRQAERRAAQALWSRIKSLPHMKRVEALHCAPTEAQWAVCELLCLESQRQCGEDPTKAIPFCELALVAADLAEEGESMRSKLRGRGGWLGPILETLCRGASQFVRQRWGNGATAETEAPASRRKPTATATPLSYGNRARGRLYPRFLRDCRSTPENEQRQGAMAP